MEIDEEDIAIFQLSVVGVIYEGPFGEIKLSSDIQKLINGKDKILVDEKIFSLAVQRYKTQLKRYFGWDIDLSDRLRDKDGKYSPIVKITIYNSYLDMLPDEDTAVFCFHLSHSSWAGLDS